MCRGVQGVCKGCARGVQGVCKGCARGLRGGVKRCELGVYRWCTGGVQGARRCAGVL